MNQKEWMDLFQSVNGRMPTDEEVQAARQAGIWGGETIAEPQIPQANAAQSSIPSDDKAPSAFDRQQPIKRATFGGVFQAPSAQATSTPHSYTVGAHQKKSVTTVSVPTPKYNRKAKIAKIFAVVLVFFSLMSAVAGGAAWWRYSSADITGTWELTRWDYYNRESSKWIDVIANYQDNDFTYADYITIDDKGNFQEDSYYYINDHKDQPYLSLGSYLDDEYIVNQWDKSIEINKSPTLFKQRVRDTLEKDLSGYYDYVKSADVNADIRSLTDNLNFTRTYTVKGETLTILTKDVNDRTISKAVYKRLSDDDAKTLVSTFEEFKSLFEKNYHIK